MRSETYMSKINLQRGILTVENRRSREKKRICSEVSVNSPGNPWSQCCAAVVKHNARNVCQQRVFATVRRATIASILSAESERCKFVAHGLVRNALTAAQSAALTWVVSDI